jgi:YggT family protein
MIKDILINFGALFCDIMGMAIFVQIMLSWIMGPANNLYLSLDSVTRPVLRIAKKVTPKMGMLDFSPVIALLGLEIIKSMWIFLITSV